MKNSIVKLSISAAMTLLLTACGGGSDTPTAGNNTPEEPVVTPPAEEVLVNTIDLQPSADFDFRTDMDVTLMVSGMSEAQGKINVYHEFEMENDEYQLYIPSMDSLITSFSPKAVDTTVIQVHKSWEKLLVEFIPTSAEGVRDIVKYELTGEDTIQVSFD